MTCAKQLALHLLEWRYNLASDREQVATLIIQLRRWTSKNEQCKWAQTI